MTFERNIQTRWLITLLLTVWCSLVVSCTSAEDVAEPDQPEEKGEPLQVVGLTRASDYVVSQEGMSMRLFTVDKGETDATKAIQTGEVSYNGPIEEGGAITWNSGLYVKNSSTYDIYGFMPYHIVEEATIDNRSAETAVLSLKGLKSLTDEDVCVITGVKSSKYQEAELQRGLYEYQPLIDDKRYGVRLLADHLYASVVFTMKINENYNKLRTVKLKEVKVFTESSSVVDVTVSLKKGVNNSSPFIIGTPTDSEGAGKDSTVVFSNEDGQELLTTTAITMKPAYFGTWMHENLYLVSTYDVYDKKGNRTRKDCTATNLLKSKLVRTVSGAEVPIKAGERVTVNLTVNPTYLYVLSEPELDNPQVTF